MIDINVIVDASPETVERMVSNPDETLTVKLKCVQRDATYKGSPTNADGAVADFVYKVVEL